MRNTRSNVTLSGGDGQQSTTATGGDGQQNNDTSTTTTGGAGTGDEQQANTTTTTHGGEQQGERTFSQADVDRIVGERLARERNAHAELQAKADELDQIKELEKTQEQRDQEALTAAQETARAAEQAAADARSEALRYRVAVEHGIGADLIDLLGTGTQEQITERAERLAALVKNDREEQQNVRYVLPPPPGQSGSGPTPDRHSPSAEDRVKSQGISRGWIKQDPTT